MEPGDRVGEFEVYNFEVEDFHTYFLSDLEILFHNACQTISNQVNDAGSGLQKFRYIENITINDREIFLLKKLFLYSKLEFFCFLKCQLYFAKQI